MSTRIGLLFFFYNNKRILSFLKVKMLYDDF